MRARVPVLETLSEGRFLAVQGTSSLGWAVEICEPGILAPGKPPTRT